MLGNVKILLPVGGVLSLPLFANNIKPIKANQNLATGCQSIMNNDHCENANTMNQTTTPATKLFIRSFFLFISKYKNNCSRFQEPLKNINPKQTHRRFRINETTKVRI